MTRQRPQQRTSFGQPDRPDRRFAARTVRAGNPGSYPAAEVPATPHHQRLVHRPLELVVALFRITVLVALAGLDGLALQAVVTQHAW